jgi:hypothetical protein
MKFELINLFFLKKKVEISYMTWYPVLFSYCYFPKFVSTILLCKKKKILLNILHRMVV